MQAQENWTLILMVFAGAPVVLLQILIRSIFYGLQSLHTHSFSTLAPSWCMHSWRMHSRRTLSVHPLGTWTLSAHTLGAHSRLDHNISLSLPSPPLLPLILTFCAVYHFYGSFHPTILVQWLASLLAEPKVMSSNLASCCFFGCGYQRL